MKWGEFRRAVERAGVTDDTDIDYIDIGGEQNTYIAIDTVRKQFAATGTDGEAEVLVITDR